MNEYREQYETSLDAAKLECIPKAMAEMIETSFQRGWLAAMDCATAKLLNEDLAKMGPKSPAPPTGLPPLPDGYVYLGRGGQFASPPEGPFYGVTRCCEGGIMWTGPTPLLGNNPGNYYAAPANSEIARLNNL